MGTLRFLLAISVVLVHAGATISTSGFGGANSVEVFYFISGFLIASVLTKGYRSRKAFYFNRFLRIFPIYWIVLLLSLTIYIITLNTVTFNPVKEISQMNIGIAISCILANLIIFGSDILCFIKINPSGIDGIVGITDSQVTGTQYLLVSPIWSLGLELVFYILAPFLNKFSNRRLILIIVFLIMIRFIAYVFRISDDPWSYRFFPFELPIFLLGILAFRFSNVVKSLIKRRILLRFLTHPVLLPIYFLIFGAIRSSMRPPRMIELFFLLSLATCIVCRDNRSRFDSTLANLSFPIYIIHYPLISFFEIYRHQVSLFDSLTKTEEIFVILIISIILAIGLTRITQPIERIRIRIRESNSNLLEGTI